MTQMLRRRAAAVWIATLIAAPATASVVTMVTDTGAAFRYELSLSSQGSDTFTSLVLPFLDLAAVPQARDVSAPFAWTAQILTDPSGDWGFDASVHARFSGLFGGGTPFETPAALLAYRYDTAGLRAAREAADGARQGVAQAEAALAATQAALAQEGRTFDTAVLVQRSLERPLQDAQANVTSTQAAARLAQSRLAAQDAVVARLDATLTQAQQDANRARLIAQLAQRRLASQSLTVSRLRSAGAPPDQIAAAEAELQRLRDVFSSASAAAGQANAARDAAQAQFDTAEAERQRLLSELALANDLARRAVEARDRAQAEFDNATAARTASEARLVALSLQLSGDLIALTQAQAALIPAEAREAAFLATQVSPGATVSGFAYLSPFGPVEGPARLGGSEAGPGFATTQVVGGPAPVPLPAGALLLLTGLAALRLRAGWWLARRAPLRVTDRHGPSAD